MTSITKTRALEIFSLTCVELIQIQIGLGVARGGSVVKFGALRPKGRSFESHCFRKIHLLFTYFMCISFPPTFTMMHLCITQFTYWTPLLFSLVLLCFDLPNTRVALSEHVWHRIALPCPVWQCPALHEHACLALPVLVLLGLDLYLSLWRTDRHTIQVPLDLRQRRVLLRRFRWTVNLSGINKVALEIIIRGASWFNCIRKSSLHELLWIINECHFANENNHTRANTPTRLQAHRHANTRGIQARKHANKHTCQTTADIEGRGVHSP